MNEYFEWISQTLGVQTDDQAEKLRQAEQSFLASLQHARETVIADGLEVLLKLQSVTIGDEVHFGLPDKHQAA